jgi:thiol-disulfide isomerase/thioredoxin
LNLLYKHAAARFSRRTCVLLLAAASLLASPSRRAHGADTMPPPKAAPAFTGIAGWLNSPPLTMAGLRGHVVLVDFWAYSCINCLRTLPFLIRFQNDYKDRGLVVIGVHAPEFKFEHDPRNVAAAITRFGINYPVALDNDLMTWNAFGNEYWPTEYLIDRQGRIVYTHIGEGNYGETENEIRKLLDAGPAVGPEPGMDLRRIGSPEMYFGLDRVENLTNAQAAQPGVHLYTAPAELKLNNFALNGLWDISGQQATLMRDGGQIRLHCHSGRVFMVASSTTPIMLGVTVDGKRQPPVHVQESRLYTLFDSDAYRDHMVTIDIPKAGFSAFTFTFG